MPQRESVFIHTVNTKEVVKELFLEDQNLKQLVPRIVTRCVFFSVCHKNFSDFSERLTSQCDVMERRCWL